MNVLDKILDRNKYFYQCMKAKIHFAATDVGLMRMNLALIEKLGRFAWRNHPGCFFDAEIENELSRYGAELENLVDADRIARDIDDRFPASKEYGTLHIATEIGSSGGHTRVIHQIIKRAKELNQAFVLTNSDTSIVPAWFKSGMDASTQILSLGRYKTHFDKAFALRALSKHFKRVVLYAHPFDVIPSLAFAVKSGVPVAVENHAHSWFWYGLSVADLIFCHTEYHTDFTRQYRNVDNCFYLPFTPIDRLNNLPGREAKKKAKAVLNIPADKTMILSVATREKYIPNSEYNYFDLLSDLLRKYPEVVFMVVGLPENDILARNIAKSERLFFYPHITDLTNYYLASDICLESMPQPSLGVQIEAPVIGLSCPMPKHGSSKVFINHFLLQSKLYRAHFGAMISKSDFFEKLDLFIKDPELRLAAAEEIRADYLKSYSDRILYEKLTEMYKILDSRKHTPNVPAETFFFDDERNSEIAETGEFHTLPNVISYWRAELTKSDLAPFIAPFQTRLTKTLMNETIPKNAGQTDNAREPSGFSSDVRLMAFYLPQFHPIPENDAWWGVGFTEWVNVRKAKPLFPGHYQPHVPSDLGYYDLRSTEAREAQAALAKKHGIHGFCYYHYWFNGKRLLHQPLDEVLASGKPDFPFCLCWANEDWTRAWDGRSGEVLIGQRYSDEDDREHIRFLASIFRDPRYIRIDDKPLFLLYRANRLPDPRRTATLWREESRRLGLGEIYLCRVESFPDEHGDPVLQGFDASVEFQPDWTNLGPKLDNKQFGNCAVYRYDDVAARMMGKPKPPYRRFPCVTPSWDNSARRQQNPLILTDSTPAGYEQWLRHAIADVRKNKPSEKLVFINAWNEWGEGNHLEPDRTFGRSYLEATVRALNPLPEANTENSGEENVLHRKAVEQATAGDLPGALSLLEECIRRSPGRAVLHNDLGVLYARLGDAGKAALHYRTAVMVEPRNATYLKNYADFLFIMQGNPVEALTLYERACGLDPGDREALFALGKLFIALNRHAEAREHLERYLRLDPSNLDAKHALEELRQKGEEEAPADTRPAITCSIVIPVFNKVSYTKKCIAELQKNTPQGLYEVIIVDNASTDETKEYLKSLAGDTFTVITNAENTGFTRACNQGARAARGEFVLFLNNDTKPCPGWLEALLDAARSDPGAGIIGSKLVYPDGKLQEAGGIIFSDGSGWNYGRFDDPDKPEYNFVREVDYVSGASLMIGRALLKELCYLDEQFSPGYYEDTDLCFAARAMGWKVLYTPFSVVIHHEGVSSGTDLSQGMKKYQVVNLEKFAGKWAEALKDQQAPGRARVVEASERGVKGNILVIDPFLPLFDRASGALRLYTVINLLRKQGHHITYLARSGQGQETYANVLRRNGIEVYATDPDVLKTMGQRANAAKIDLQRILTARRYAVAYLSLYEIAIQYLDAIRSFSPDTRIAVDTVDIHFIREMRKAKLVNDAAGLKQAQLMRTRELGIYSRADAVITVTEQDWDHVREALAGKPHFVIPNIHSMTAAPARPEGREGLLFVGNFAHPPNIDAVVYFVKEIFPLVRKAIPGTTFTIAGNNPPREVADLQGNGVTVTGYVPSTTPYLEKARVSVAPLRYGAGMKGKIGEAMAHGLPVVTTTVGAEGMELVNGETAFIADAPEEFARMIVRLMNDDDLWRTVSLKGRQFIQDNFSPDKAGSLLAAMIETLAKLQPSSGTCRATGLSVLPQEFVQKNVVSIVIPTFNELKYTKECVESIRRNTPEPHELIFVDNGSTDGTVKWLNELVKDNTNYHLIENSKNRGFSKGCNQGITVSSGEYLLLLNNDVVVTTCWLSRMLECLAGAQNVGIVGAMTNNSNGIQKVDGVSYTTMTEREDFANAFSERHRHRRIPSRTIVGFCMLFRRRLFDKIGLLDERFGSGKFGAEDYCLRAALLGHQNLIAGDVFIHHYGSRSFIGNTIDYSASLSEDKKLFNEKWTGVKASSLLGTRMIALKAVERARELHEQGRLDLAVDALVAAIKHAPEAIEIYCCLAELFLEDHKYQEALDSLKPISGSAGQFERVLLLTGYAMEGLELYGEAEKCADRVLAVQPRSAMALNLKGILSHKQGDLAAAERFFLAACGTDPGYGEPFTNLGVMKWTAGNKNEALDLMEKGFVLSPAVPDIGTLYYSAATDLQRFAAAEARLHEAKMLHPNSRHISILLLDCFVLQEKYSLAMDLAEESLLLFGIEQELLAAALAIREKVGPRGPGPDKEKNGALSLGMMARNEEKQLPAYLKNSFTLADEIIVIDSGSSDRTADIARVFGARVLACAGEHDCSAARVRASELAAGKKTFFLDAEHFNVAADPASLQKLIEAAGIAMQTGDS